VHLRPGHEGGAGAVTVPDDWDLAAVFAHGGAQTFLPSDAPDRLPTVGVRSWWTAWTGRRLAAPRVT